MSTSMCLGVCCNAPYETTVSNTRCMNEKCIQHQQQHSQCGHDVNHSFNSNTHDCNNGYYVERSDNCVSMNDKYTDVEQQRQIRHKCHHHQLLHSHRGTCNNNNTKQQSHHGKLLHSRCCDVVDNDAYASFSHTSEGDVTVQTLQERLMEECKRNATMRDTVEKLRSLWIADQEQMKRADEELANLLVLVAEGQRETRQCQQRLNELTDAYIITEERLIVQRSMEHRVHASEKSVGSDTFDGNGVIGDGGAEQDDEEDSSKLEQLLALQRRVDRHIEHLDETSDALNEARCGRRDVPHSGDLSASTAYISEREGCENNDIAHPQSLLCKSLLAFEASLHADMLNDNVNTL